MTRDRRPAPGSLPPVSREEEQRLFRRWREEGDLQAREQLAKANLRFVARIAREYSGNGLTYDQLFSAGSEGLAVALDRFDPTRGAKFISFAVWWIRARIGAALARVPVTSGIGVQPRAIQHAERVRQLEQEHGRTVTDDEARQALGWRRDPEHLLHRAAAAAAPVHLDDPIDDNHPAPLVGRLAAPGPDPERAMEQKETAAVLAQLVEQLPIRERLVVRMYFGLDGDSGDYSFSDMGDLLGFSMQRTHQLLGRALGRLRQWAMEPEGPGAQLGELR